MRRASSYARSAGTPAAISARAIRPFEYGSVGAAERQRLGVARMRSRRHALLHRGVGEREQRVVEARRDDLVVGEHDLGAALRRAASATTSIAAAFSSTR